jgi:hypothetical protein
MANKSEMAWLAAPRDTNYPAALSYLSLTFPAAKAKSLVRALKAAPMSSFKSKDIFRASGLSLLGLSNFHVERDRRKIRSGEAISPLLLVRVPELAKVIVADGYHRLCAVYSLDEDAAIPCKIV